MGGIHWIEFFQATKMFPALENFGKTVVKNSKFLLKIQNLKDFEGILKAENYATRGVGKCWLWGGFTHLFSGHLLGVVILLMEEILHQLIGRL